MKVTFPRLGSMHIFCKAIAETAGIPYILPPETSRKTLTLGVLHSNESICLPFKIILGNFIEALQMGADTIVMVGSGPPCRLGLYDLVQKVILEDMGLHYRWLTIPASIKLEGDVEESRGDERAEKRVECEECSPLPLWALDGVEEDDGLRGIRTIGHEGQTHGDQERRDSEAIEEGPLLGG